MRGKRSILSSLFTDFESKNKRKLKGGLKILTIRVNLLLLSLRIEDKVLLSRYFKVYLELLEPIRSLFAIENILLLLLQRALDSRTRTTTRFDLTLEVPIVTKINFLLTISIHCQEISYVN